MKIWLPKTPEAMVHYNHFSCPFWYQWFFIVCSWIKYKVQQSHIFRFPLSIMKVIADLGRHDVILLSIHRIKIKGSADGSSWEKHLPFILLTLPTSNLLFVFVHCSVCTMGYKYQNPTLIKIMQRLLIFKSKYVGAYWQLQQLVLSEKRKYCYLSHTSIL